MDDSKQVMGEPDLSTLRELVVHKGLEPIFPFLSVSYSIRGDEPHYIVSSTAEARAKGSSIQHAFNSWLPARNSCALCGAFCVENFRVS